MATSETPLDEIQWRHPQLVMSMGGIHSNTVMWYFAESPFFDRTSNNAVLQQQAAFNPQMEQYVSSREALEGRLKTMSGLEFMVAEQPAVMGPGCGTGVWVIRKQVRRKRPGAQDELTVLATYYVVGDNIYMAPTLADVLSFRMTTISSALRKCFPAADSATVWSPTKGHEYRMPPAAAAATGTTNARGQTLASKEATPMPDSQAGRGAAPDAKKPAAQALDARLTEQSFAIHMRYGGDYMDENPITGRPGDFHLSSTGRRGKLVPPALTNLNTSFTNPSPTAAPDLAGTAKAKDGKGDKTPKTPTGGLSKPRRKKSKSGTTPIAS